MEAVNRCFYRFLNRKHPSFPATWSALRHNCAKSNSTPVPKTCRISTGIGKPCASALHDTARGMASKTVKKADCLVWLDMEMTGLDVDNCHIMEIACLITDSDLEVISDDFQLIIHQPDEVLASMNDWCVEQHGKTGLTDACRASKTSLGEAEELTLKFLADHVPEKKCPIAGNSVWMDRIFLKKYMPLVDEYAHYRIVDVSAVKELARRWCPQLYGNAPAKQFNHRALDDIRESIIELKYYKSKIFNP